MSTRLIAATPDPTTTTPAAATGTAGSIDPLVLIAVTLLLAGVLLLIFAWPRSTDRRNSDRSFVRSWIAVALVLGLLLFTGAVLFTPNTDAQLRTTLVTALTTSVAAAISFYFATKANAQAVAALAPDDTDPVPNLTGLTVAEALTTLGTTGFKLANETGEALTPSKGTIGSQDPAPATRASIGSAITVKVT